MMSGDKRLLLIGITMTCLSSCGGEVRFVEKGDVALELLNFSGEWEEVALIHGHFGDLDGCNDIKELLEERFTRTYRCRELRP